MFESGHAPSQDKRGFHTLLAHEGEELKVSY